MNRPNLPAGIADIVAQDHLEFFMLVKLEFDTGTVYISGADFDVGYEGEVWTSLRGLGSVDPIVESDSEIPGISLTLSGVPNEAIIHAQTEAYRGRKVTIKWAFFDADDVLCVDSSAWMGFMDVPIITRGKETSTIQVSAENRMIDWQRPRGSLFNHADQQQVDATDNFFLGIESMVEKEVVLFLPQAYSGYGGSAASGPNMNTRIDPNNPPLGDDGKPIVLNIDIMNAFREYYDRTPEYGGYNAFAQSGLFGSALMIVILESSRPSGTDFDMAISRGWNPNDASAKYFPSELHPGIGDWTGPIDGGGE